MPLFAGADYYITHPDNKQVELSLDDMTAEKLDAAVQRASVNNQQREAAALSKADSYSFQIAHPEFLRTAENTRLINHWLQTQGIANPLYADFEAAYNALSDVLTIDQAEIAKQQDRKTALTFKGVLTKRTYTSLEDLIANERQAALQQIPQPTPDETLIEKLPIEEAQALLRAGERAGQQRANILKTKENADAWLLANPWWVDNDKNAHLMVVQLRANGVAEGAASIADYQKAAQQLRDSGLLTLNRKVVEKQHAKELQARATEVVNNLSFDETEAYRLPLDEVRRRASGNFSGRD